MNLCLTSTWKASQRAMQIPERVRATLEIAIFTIACRELDVQLCQLGQSNFLWSLTKSAQTRLAAATD